MRCDSCGKKVYRPRGRAVSGGGSNVPGQGNSEGMEQDAGQDGGAGNPSNEGSPSEGQGNDEQSKAAQAASQAIGKPLSQQAQQAISKIEQALRQEVQRKLQEMQRQMEQQQKQQQQELAQQVEEQVETLRPTEVIVKSTKTDGTQQQVTVPNAHKLLPEVLRLISAGIRNFLLVGPSGSGKTTLAYQLAEALAVPFGLLGWSGDTTPGTVLGRPTPDGTGFTLSAWLQLYDKPSVFCHDEIDGADPNVPICMNGAIENGRVFLPTGKLERHAEHIVIATANTWGIGADMLYCGRNQLDAAVRDRFVGGCILVEYDADLERSLVPEDSYRQAFWEIRAKIFEHKLRRIWGTRTLLRGALLLRGGYSQQEIFKRLTVGFSADELAKLGI